MNTISLTYSGRETQIEIQTGSPSAYTVGDRAWMDVPIDDSLVRLYADHYGDRNPIHLDENAGRESVFGSRVAHGMLTFNFFSTLLGAGFPGPGTIFVGVHDWKFTAPVRIGDRIRVQVGIASARQKKNGSYDLVFDASAADASGKAVITGRLTVIAPALPR